MNWDHGGDWAGFQEKHGKPPLDFSASTTPLPMPEGIRTAVLFSLDRADRYPDPLCRELTAVLAERYGISQKHILCGAGAADLLFRLALAKHPRRALIVEPTFSGYAEALAAAGCREEQFFLREADGFALTETFLPHIRVGVDVLFLCNPNNPTGRTIDLALLRKILNRCGECGTLLVLDECFNDFLDDPKVHSLTDELEGHPNLLILRSFTKWYPLAGLRLGYALCSDAALLEEMRVRGQPWPVSAAAQAAGLAALKETAYDVELTALIQEQRQILTEDLTRLGCRVVPGEANFLLFQSPVSDLEEKLEEQGVLIRNCDHFPGLGSGWYRAAVRTAAENQTLLRAIKEVL